MYIVMYWRMGYLWDGEYHPLMDPGQIKHSIMVRNMFMGICAMFIVSGCADKKEYAYNHLSTIMYVRGDNNGDISYFHYVLADGADRDHLDSSKTVDMLKHYIDTCSNGLPIYVICLFNKVEDFDRGENLSQPRSFFRNEIANVYFDTATYKPMEFVFFDDGEEDYRGKRWLNK